MEDSDLHQQKPKAASVDRKGGNKAKPLFGRPRPEYSRGVRLSSRPADMDAGEQLKKLAHNKIKHMQFEPSYCNKQWRKHYQEIFDVAGIKVNVEK